MAMKRYLLSVIFAVLGVCTFAQEGTEPMKFMGIPLDLPVKKIVSELKHKGLKKISNGKMILFKGKFATLSDCIIGIVPDENDKSIVQCTTVMLPGTNNWETLQSGYKAIHTMLTVKYGEPTISREEFDSYSEPQTDSERMHELRMGRCKYSSDYHLKNGTINLNITTNHEDKGCVMLFYFPDNKNQTNVSKAIDDL